MPENYRVINLLGGNGGGGGGETSAADVKDSAHSGSELAELMGGVGSYAQSQINEKVAESINGSEAQVVQVADYDEQGTHSVGDKAIHEGIVYVCTEEISSPESWDSSKWDELTELADNTIYEIVTDADPFTLPGVPQASANRQGITVYITAATGQVSLDFQSGYDPSWFGEQPESFVLSAGKKIVLFILDGIIAFSDVTVTGA